MLRIRSIYCVPYCAVPSIDFSIYIFCSFLFSKTQKKLLKIKQTDPSTKSLPKHKTFSILIDDFTRSEEASVSIVFSFVNNWKFV